jgi:hypothetical protein
MIILSASLGGVDRELKHEPQSIEHDYFLFTDGNLPPRDKALTPRLQAKIPKMFGWQLAPNHDYYLWLDGNIRLSHKDSLKHYLDPDYDLVVFRHPKRPNIRQEARYLRKGLREESIYLVNRYAGEWTPEQENEFTDFEDDLLVIGGVFLYKNTPEVHALMKEWWYLTTRYSVFDQLSFSYLIKKSNLKVKVLDEDFNNSPYVQIVKHRKR